MSDSQAQWICCQLGAREHYAVPRALHRHGALDALVTDVWCRPTSAMGALRSGIRARYHEDLRAACVCASNASNFVFELRAKVSGLGNWPLMITRNHWFQEVAIAKLSRLKSSEMPRTVMAYSYAALDILKFARSRGWRTVLGQIDPGPVEERIVSELYDADPLQRSVWQRAPRQYWSSWREECELADRIVVNSQWSHAALVSEGIPASKISIIPLAYDERASIETPHRKYPQKFTRDRPLHVLFLGQVNLRKGIGPLLDAIRMLQGEPIKFSIVGPQQISIPADLRVHPQVGWLGGVSRQNTGRFYRDADVLLFPTFSDGFGIIQLEAQACGLPIIASRHCGDVVQDGRNGWLLSDVTPNTVVAAIRRLLFEPALLKEASANSCSAEEFGLSSVGKRWLRIFDS